MGFGPSIFQDFVDEGVVKRNMFSTCLRKEGGLLLLGEGSDSSNCEFEVTVRGNVEAKGKMRDGSVEETCAELTKQSRQSREDRRVTCRGEAKRTRLNKTRPRSHDITQTTRALALHGRISLRRTGTAFGFNRLRWPVTGSK